MNFSSKLLQNAVDEFGRLPGIGNKTALRLVLHLLRQQDGDVKRFTAALDQLKEQIKYCQDCFSISDPARCEICSSLKREKSTIWFVEDVRAARAREHTE